MDTTDSEDGILNDKMTATKRGAFLVFEGCDRSGKSTQSRLLTEYLQKNGIPVKQLAFPARQSNIGQMINSYLTNKQDLNDQVIHLLFSSNRWEYMKSIRNYLESGTTLVVDRYSYSGVAYSVAKGLPYDWCYAPERGLIRPDAVFYLQAPTEQLTDRGNYGDERYEKEEFQVKVAKVFERIASENASYWLQINACQPAEVLNKIITDNVLKLIEEETKKPLKVLK